MRKTTGIIFIGILGLLAFNYREKTVYDEIPGKPYQLIIPGEKVTYKTDFRTYVAFYDLSFTEKEGKQYLKRTIDYGKSQSIAYYREEKGDILYLKENNTKETLQTPANPEAGMIWYESDSTWRYIVTNVAVTFETPVSRFTNCLEIQSEDLTALPGQYTLYTQYYQRGRGYVGTKIGGVLYSYLLLPGK